MKFQSSYLTGIALLLQAYTNTLCRCKPTATRQKPYLFCVTCGVHEYLGNMITNSPYFLTVTRRLISAALTPERIPYWGALVSFFLCGVPLIGNWSLYYGNANKDQNKIGIALQSTIFQNFLISGISLTTPVAIDFVINKFAFLWKRNQKEHFPYNGFVGLLFPLVIMMTVVAPQGRVRFVAFIFHCQRIYYTQMFLFHTFKCGYPVWTEKRAVFLAVFLTFSEVLACYVPFLRPGSSLPLEILIVFFRSITTIRFAILVRLWIKYLKTKHSGGSRVTHCEYCCNLYLIALAVSITGIWIVNGFYRPTKFVDNGKNYLCANVALVSVLAVVLILSHMSEHRRTMRLTRVTH